MSVTSIAMPDQLTNQPAPKVPESQHLANEHTNEHTNNSSGSENKNDGSKHGKHGKNSGSSSGTRLAARRAPSLKVVDKLTGKNTLASSILANKLTG